MSNLLYHIVTVRHDSTKKKKKLAYRQKILFYENIMLLEEKKKHKERKNYSRGAAQKRIYRGPANSKYSAASPSARIHLAAAALDGIIRVARINSLSSCYR